MGQLNKKRKIKYIFLCSLCLLTVLFSSFNNIPTYAANNKLDIKLMAFGVTRTDKGQHNSTTFYDYDPTLAWFCYPLSSSFVTAFYTIEGLPYGSFDITIDYTVSMHDETSYVIVGSDNTWSAGTQYEGEALKHGTKFYFDIGGYGKEIGHSSTTTVNSNGYGERRSVTFHVNDYICTTACIAVSYYVNVSSNQLTSSGNFPVSFKVNNVTYTTTEEHVQESLDNITNPDSADKEFTDDFQNSMGNQSGQVDNLVNDMNSMDKVDIDNAGNITNESIDFNAVNDYSSVLGAITSSNIVKIYMITLFGIALCAYVLFGKRR